jgi:hypothetical protein
MTVSNAAADDSTVPAGLSTPMGDDPADHHAREHEQADSDGEAEPEGQAGKSGHGIGNREPAVENRGNESPDNRHVFIRLPFSGSRLSAPG